MQLNLNNLLKLLPPLKAGYAAFKSGDYATAAKQAAVVLVHVLVYTGVVVLISGCAIRAQPLVPNITIEEPKEQQPVTILPG